MNWENIDLSIKNRDNIVQERAEVKQDEPEKVTVPIVEEKKEDTNSPVEGYYVEKTSQPPVPETDDDDEFDTTIDPQKRITLNQSSITIYNETNNITNIMEQSINRAASDAFKSTSEDSFMKAQDLLKGKKSYSCFDNFEYKNRFNLYGKAVYEGTNYNYRNEFSDSKLTFDSEKVDLGLNWKSKKEKTKVFLFGSYTHTEANGTITPINVNEAIPTGQSENSYSVYGAIQHKFKNGDVITGSAFQVDDKNLLIKTTDIDANYFYRKFMVLVQGNTTFNKVGNLDTVSKTNFTISLNPELALEPQKNEEQKEDTTTTETDTKEEPKKNEKKWTVEHSPFFDTQSLSGASNGNVEEGLGEQIRFNRTGKDSILKIGAFGKVSTTQEESNKYHVTFGSGIKYAKTVGSKSAIKATFDIKDRVTFGHGNILTMSAKANYSSPKLTAELEGEYINVTQGDQPSYAGLVGRVFYTPNKNVNLFAEAAITDLRDIEGRTKINNLEAGIIVNF